MRRYSSHLWVASVAAWCLTTSAAKADLITNFEAPAYTGSVAGTALDGQNSWYIPPVAGSTGQFVFPYAGNALTFAANPAGGAQFIGANGPGTSNARGQIDTSFASFPQWTITYDVAHRFNGTLPTVNNIGSFSTQATAVPKQIIALATWTDPATAANWNAGYNVADAAGTVATQSAGAAFNSLLVNHWYRESMTFNFTNNRVTSVSITDLSTGVSNVFNPTTWYLAGGATGNGLLIPTGVRFFAGSTTAGNTAGYDNLSIIGSVPEPSSLVLLGTGLFGAVGARFRKRRQAEKVTEESPA